MLTEPTFQFRREKGDVPVASSTTQGKKMTGFYSLRYFQESDCYIIQQMHFNSLILSDKNTIITYSYRNCMNMRQISVMVE